MSEKKPSILERCYKDKDGNVVIYQSPNAPIVGWFVFMVVERLSSNSRIDDIASLLAFGCLFTWGWLELFGGATYIRQFLGGLILFIAVATRL